MDENLVGYLLKALEPDAQRQVGDYLRERPEARQRLEWLRQALEPLAADRDAVEPPAGLALRTIARVAEYRCRALPRAPQVAAGRSGPTRTRWRRADVVVAASILICATLLTLPLVNLVRDRYDRIACANNLRGIGAALTVYSHRSSTATFPDAARPFDEGADAPPARQAAAGMFIPVLARAGVLDEDQVSVRCPAVAPRQACGWTLDQLRGLSGEDFKKHAPELVPGYAYTLGYRDHGRIRGLCRTEETVPIVADRPPVQDAAESAFRVGNSPNHGGRGQNVLFTDGHVEWRTDHVLDGDDFFVNEQDQIAAGLHWHDYVLGPSGAHP